MATPTVYVICDQNCKFESMTKEQILAAITQAVREGTVGDIDTGFVQTIKTINGSPLRFFVGEQYEYDALADADKKDLFAIITNDTTKDGIVKAIEVLQNEISDLKRNISNTYLPRDDKALHINYFIDTTRFVTNTDIYIGESARSIERVSNICITMYQSGRLDKRQLIGVRGGLVLSENGYKYIDFIITGGGYYYVSTSELQDPVIIQEIGFVRLKEKDGELYLNIRWCNGIGYKTGMQIEDAFIVDYSNSTSTLEYLSVLYD